MFSEMVALYELVCEAYDAVRADAESDGTSEAWGCVRLLEEARHKMNGAAGYAQIRAVREGVGGAEGVEGGRTQSPS